MAFGTKDNIHKSLKMMHKDRNVVYNHGFIING